MGSQPYDKSGAGLGPGIVTGTSFNFSADAQLQLDSNTYTRSLEDGKIRDVTAHVTLKSKMIDEHIEKFKEEGPEDPH